MSDTYNKLIEEIDDFTRVPMPGAPVSATRSGLAMLMDASAALRVLNNPGRTDFASYLQRQTETKLARAEHEASSVRIELRLMRERCAELMSQHEPVNGLGLDRELVRQVLHYVQCGRLK